MRFVTDGAYTVGYDEQGVERMRVVAQTPPDPPLPRWITVGALFDRMGESKGAILASNDPAIRALITDCMPRKYIDLDRPDLPAGLQTVAAAFPSVDPATVLNAPIRDIERP